MDVIIWDDSFSVGIHKIDNQHQHLFHLLNEFYNNCVSKSLHEEQTELFDELIHYAIYHFAEEEYWMEKSSFDGFDMHKKEHEKFSMRVVALCKEYYGGNKHILLETSSFLNNWIKNHILEVDAKFGKYIASNYMDIV
jgi:hemerythrin